MPRSFQVRKGPQIHCQPTVASSFSIVTDASPWGLGGVLTHNGSPITYFSSPLVTADFRKFQAKAGEPKFMPIWEALAILVALRAWTKFLSSNTEFMCKCDNLGVVFNQNKRSSKNPHVNIVLREIALHECKVPGLVIRTSHVLGQANVWPDALSRLTAPEGHRKTLPAEIASLKETTVSERVKSWWLCQ